MFVALAKYIKGYGTLLGYCLEKRNFESYGFLFNFNLFFKTNASPYPNVLKILSLFSFFITSSCNVISVVN